jgi:maltose alpha-D-glucosyltransferase / alpha-amylase
MGPFKTENRSLLGDDAIRSFLLRQRWFGGKARTVVGLHFVDRLELIDNGSVVVCAVQFGDGGTDEYLLPLVMLCGDAAATVREKRPEALVTTGESDDVMADGLSDDDLCTALLALIRSRQACRTAAGLWTSATESQWPTAPMVPIRRTAPDQSNTSVLFGDAAILKIFRRIEPGPNPDVEMCAFLTRRGFPHVPRTLGTVEYARDGSAPAAVAMLQQFVPNRGNGWEVMLDAVIREQTDDRSQARNDAHVLPGLLGRRTGELHVELTAGDTEALAREPFTSAALMREAAGMRRRANNSLELLAGSLRRLEQPARERATTVLDGRGRLFEAFDDLERLANAGTRIRCHGDYHLGQTLVTEDDVVILDFEGEPARPLAERREKSSPLRDVAGMLRSFSYLAAAATTSRTADAPTPSLAGLQTWERQATRRFLDEYLQAVSAAQVLPADPAAVNVLLRAYVADKAIYEISYELNNRPEWVELPLLGVLGCLDAERTGTEVWR